jgi:uncharacterized protein (TIGR02757 family)
VRRSTRPDLPRLTERLELLRREWSGRRLESDPLVFAHDFEDPGDREVVAFLSASLAFGRVASIQASIARVLGALGPSPAAFFEEWDGGRIRGLGGFVHRWVTREDVEDFLRTLSRTLSTHGSLRLLFERGDLGEPDFVPALDRFYAALRATCGAPLSKFSRGLRFLLPSPGDGSACKRAHLFLRWMVRREDLDLGLWTGGAFSPARLLLPMDTHVHRISSYLGLTRRKTADLAAAREATGYLKRIAPEDPVAYDWSLSRLGILAECVRERTRRHCERCAVRPVCRVSLVSAVAPPAALEEAVTT